jgi:hypothetical protein
MLQTQYPDVIAAAPNYDGQANGQDSYAEPILARQYSRWI